MKQMNVYLWLYITFLVFPLFSEEAISEGHSEYIKNKKIYGIGIKQDPIEGSKMSKGRQDLTSPIWLGDLSRFIASKTERLRQIISSAKKSGDPYIYLLNHANACLFDSLETGLHTKDALNSFL